MGLEIISLGFGSTYFVGNVGMEAKKETTSVFGIVGLPCGSIPPFPTDNHIVAHPDGFGAIKGAWMLSRELILGLILHTLHR